VLSGWLAGVYVVDDPMRGIDSARNLKPGELLVTAQGHTFGAASASFHATDSEMHGILSRQREIESLFEERTEADRQLREARDTSISSARAELEDVKARVVRTRAEVAELQDTQHQLKVDHVRLSQLAERVTSRGTQIIQELEEIGQEVEREREQIRKAFTELENASGQIESLRSLLGASSETLDQADARLKEAREQAERATREHQEGVFLEKTISSKIDGLEETVRNLHKERLRLDDDAERLAGEIAQVDGISVEAQLQTQLADKAEHEQALAGKRNAMEMLEAQLGAAEKSRLATEQSLQPLRDRIGELRLKEQEARLAKDNFAQQLAEAGADLQALASELEKGVRASQLQGQITRITGEIEALGAINLAALEELGTVRERKAYLDSQAQDLTEALATLENAIRRIDRETRERLQDTFNQVSDKFSEMFPALFGGGEAKLVLTGDEILDAGIQVIARPPGKRNSSIHLLSGGEKALTALALVFSMFQLNPAPFCLLDEVDAPLDDVNTTRYCDLVKKMSASTQFVFITHNKITMELAEQLVGVTMQEQGVSRVVSVDIEDAIRLQEEVAA